MDHYAATRNFHSRSPAPNRSPAPYDSPRSTLNRSPGRGGPFTTFADSELTALRSRIAAGVRMSRRATADAPLTGGMSERIGLFSSSSGYTNTTSSSNDNSHQVSIFSLVASLSNIEDMFSLLYKYHPPTRYYYLKIANAHNQSKFHLQ